MGGWELNQQLSLPYDNVLQPQLAYQTMIHNRDFVIELPNLDHTHKKLVMKRLPHGEFIMGRDGDKDGDECQFKTEITQGFWLSQYPITVAQWYAVQRQPIPNDKLLEGNLPITNIDWFKAIKFCKRVRSFAQGLSEKSFIFTLPTEAQWEYACKGNLQNDSGSNLIEASWTRENSEGQVQAVGQKAANHYGLYDLIGNVQHWCLDSPSDYPCTADPIIVNLGNSDWVGYGMGHLRSIRGASVGNTIKQLDCGIRGWGSPNTQDEYIGFRLCFSQKHKLPKQVRLLQFFLI